MHTAETQLCLQYPSAQSARHRTAVAGCGFSKQPEAAFTSSEKALQSGGGDQYRSYNLDSSATCATACRGPISWNTKVVGVGIGRSILRKSVQCHAAPSQETVSGIACRRYRPPPCGPERLCIGRKVSYKAALCLAAWLIAFLASTEKQMVNQP